MYITQYLLRPEEGVRSCGTGATGSCEKPDCVVGTEFWVLWKICKCSYPLSHLSCASPHPQVKPRVHSFTSANTALQILTPEMRQEERVKGIQLRTKLYLLAVA